MYWRYTRPLVLVLMILVSCGSGQERTASLSGGPGDYPASGFGDYWYQGKAEVSSYSLQQARYGELREGHAVLVFVTEPFSKRKQVKLDYAGRSPQDEVSVLKLNFVKKFTTGVYPYSMMSSVFTPVEIGEYPRSLKSTTTSQEWCGHTFTQFNLQGDRYALSSRSYFESEGDEDLQLDAAWLEDEVWARIRINPETLPTGRVSMIPGSMIQRLSHEPFKVQQVEASLEAHPSDEALQIYRLQYSNRELAIAFGKAFPFEITGWEETQRARGEVLTTRATKKKQMLLDYWSRNRNADAYLRDELGL